MLAKYGVVPIWHEHEGAPEFVKPVLRLESDIQALLELVSLKEQHIRIVRKPKPKFALYGFADGSGHEYGHSIQLPNGIKFKHSLWPQDAGGKSSNYKELRNLVEDVEEEAGSGQLQDCE
eukprot:7145986-Ditylum_brightwellii.AAC.2